MHPALPDQTGRTFVITGANSGIGRQTARALAAAGAIVVLAVRNRSKGEDAASSMTGSTEVHELDLASLDSIRAFAARWGERPIDVLINNAGVANLPASRTVDGFELNFGTNHLGHFALTNLLLAQITDRVTTVASLAHYAGWVGLEDLNWQRRRYRFSLAYGQSKLANIVFVGELQRRLTAAGSSVIATASHPGVANTQLAHDAGNRAFHEFHGLLNKLLGQSEEDGAQPTLVAATADLPGDTYIGPGGRFQLRGTPKPVGRARRATDTDVARRLWDLSERLTHTRFPFDSTTATRVATRPGAAAGVPERDRLAAVPRLERHDRRDGFG